MLVNLFSSQLLLASVSLSSAAQNDASGPDTPREIYGGELADVCQFPSTVFNRENGCSGTLVHPRVVIHAGHCGQPSEFQFGEDGDTPARRVQTKWCETTDFEVSDYAICVLQEAVDDVPIAPIIQGCEADVLQPGTKITLAGFGNSNNANGGKSFGVKRFVEVEINSLTDTEAYIGGMDGKGGCNGDSGGPAFVQLADGTWRTFGATHGGDMHPNCAEGSWKLTHVALPWYEEQLTAHGETEIDLSPCFDEQGNWDPTDACGGYAKDIAGPFGTWDDGCSDGAPVGEKSATCAPPDMQDPVVEIDSPADGKTFEEGEAITVTATATDDVAVVSVDLLVDDQSQGEVAMSPYSWKLDDLPVGMHELTAVAVDGAGNEAQSMKVTIEVVGPMDTSEESTSMSNEDSTSSTSDPSSTSDSTSMEESSSAGDSQSGGTDESGTSQSSDSAQETSSGAGEDTGSAGGCACSVDRRGWLPSALAGAGMLVVGVFGRRRRR